MKTPASKIDPSKQRKEIEIGIPTMLCITAIMHLVQGPPQLATPGRGAGAQGTMGDFLLKEK